MELLLTERAYVEELDLLQNVFYAELNDKNRQHKLMSDDVLQRMVGGLTSIYQLHHLILPDLEHRLAEW